MGTPISWSTLLWRYKAFVSSLMLSAKAEAPKAKKPFDMELANFNA